MALMFPMLTMIEEKSAMNLFNNFVKRIERFCVIRGAKISGYRALERGPDGCTIHIHVWLWVSDPKLLKDVHQKIEDEWTEAAGYKRRESTATDVQVIQSEAHLAGCLWYMAKQDYKQDISGVPPAPIRKQNLPIAEPQMEEVDLPQAKFLKEEVNKTLGRRNDPSPRCMIFNLPRVEWERIKRESYSYRQGPTPSEDQANKVRAAELGDDWYSSGPLCLQEGRFQATGGLSGQRADLDAELCIQTFQHVLNAGLEIHELWRERARVDQALEKQQPLKVAVEQLGDLLDEDLFQNHPRLRAPVVHLVEDLAHVASSPEQDPARLPSALGIPLHHGH